MPEPTKRYKATTLKFKQATESHSNKDMEQNKVKQLKYEIVKGKPFPTKCKECKDSEPILTEKQIKEKEEQERTKINKGLFLDYYKTIRVMEMVCKKIDISFVTFWRWRDNDPEFAKAVLEIRNKRGEHVEDILMGLIFVKHDGPSVRYFLDRTHPDYKPHSVTEVITGTRTLEDILDEAEKKLKDKKNAGGITTGPENID